MSDINQCTRCGRELKTEKSIKDGLGPVCKQKHEAEIAERQSKDKEGSNESR